MLLHDAVRKKPFSTTSNREMPIVKIFSTEHKH